MMAGILAVALGGCAGNHVERLTERTVEGELAYARPAGWSVEGEDSDLFGVYRDRLVVHGGQAAVSILSCVAQDNQRLTLQQAVDAGDFAGRRVAFRAFMRTNRVRGSARLWMRADTRTHMAVAFDYMARRRVRGTSDWQEYAIVLDLPVDTTKLLYGVILAGPGQIWLDDCSLEEVRGNISVTEWNRGGYRWDARPEPQLLPGPANLDFEGNFSER
jgi:hypothetical protein